MSARARLPAIGLCVLLTCAAALRAQAPVLPQASVVLLRNGRLLRGTVANEGEQILVSLAPGSQVRLPRGEVQIVARSLDELAGIQRRQLHADDVNSRIQLARWCVRNELPTQAGELLIELERLAPNRAEVIALERQLRQSAATASGPTNTAKSVDPSPTPAGELESLVKEISPLAFDNYMKQVQPLLLNHCAASGCHGVASRTDFQLLRPLSGTRLTQRMTQRNLQSTLKHIDRDDPLASPLLSAATTTHGGLAEPILAGPMHQRNVEALRQWLESTISSEPPSDGSDASPSPTPPNLPQDVRRESSPTQPIFAQVQPKDPKARAAPDVRRGAEPEYTARDPFDPEAFNRRFFPERFQP